MGEADLPGPAPDGAGRSGVAERPPAPDRGRAPRRSRRSAGLMRGRLQAFAAALAAALCMAAASDPADRLPDPAQEAKARAIFQQIRCVVCQNESIDDSEAPLAHDLRQIVRDQVRQGRSEAQIKAFLVARYGQFVLLRPSFSLGNAPLWLLTPALVLGGSAWL